MLKANNKDNDVNLNVCRKSVLCLLIYPRAEQRHLYLPRAEQRRR